MKKLMTLFTRTPLHVGSGSSVGAIDLPVQRERHTRIPVIPGTALKGVLADLWREYLDDNGGRKKGSELAKLFGYAPPAGSDEDKDSCAGSLMIGEARVIAFPVRSARGSFAWLTCPLALQRLARDRQKDLPSGSILDLDDNSCQAAEGLIFKDKEKVVFEEYCFAVEGEQEKVSQLSGYLQKLCDDPVWKKSLAARLAVVSDGIFSHFVENACEVVTRIKVDDRTGTVVGGALFNQEQVPSEALFAATIEARLVKAAGLNPEDAFQALSTRVETAGSTIQVGGDETTGLGLCSVKLLEVK